MNNITENELEYIIARVLENAIEAHKDKDKSEFVSGKKLAYYEILDTIKNELLVRDIDVSKYGLNFDLESII